MFDLESYKKNIDVNNEYGLDNIAISKKFVYNGSLSHFNKNKTKEKKKISDLPPLAAAVIGSNNTVGLLPATSESRLWTDIDVQESYINSKPPCYLILGKPGAGSYSLGEAISKKLKCIHLCPKNVLFDEIAQESSTGKCITFNLRQKKAIKYDTILAIMNSKLESPAINHRGYIMSGIPMVTSDMSNAYYSNSLYCEEAYETVDDLLFETIANLKKKRPKQSKTSSSSSLSSGQAEPEQDVEEEQQEENIEEEDERPVELPKFILDSCSGIINTSKIYMTSKKSMVLKQLQTLLKMSLQADYIIYLTCPDLDMVTKKKHKYYNYTTDLYTFDNLLANVEAEQRWPTKYTISDYVHPHESYIFNPKYNCRHPINFEKNTISQLCTYKNHILPFVEEKIKDFHPKHIIKLDARQTVHQMMHSINERRYFLSNIPIFIPEPLYLEDPPEEMEDFWKLVEELNVIKSGALSINRYPSLWYNRCPVELKKRRTVRGHPKYAVSFFKHVYLLSSLDNMISFCRNPRPYLCTKFLEPTCRIFVTGTKSSGKSMISSCLSWIFDTTITSYNEFLENERAKKYHAYSKTILSEIIATIEDARLLVWQAIETERVKDLNSWLFQVSNNLRNYIPIYIEYLKTINREPITEMEEEENIPSTTDLFNEYNSLQALLSFLPFLDDVEECIKVLDDNSLITFAPLDLITVTKRPAVPVLGDEDVTEAIDNYIKINELQKEIEPTTEELILELSNILKRVDEESQQKDGTYGKYIIDGIPSDIEFWDSFYEAKLLPDYTISLIENREVDLEIIENYIKLGNCPKNYQERFSLADDPLISRKLLDTKLPNSAVIDVQIIVPELITMALSSMNSEESEENEETIIKIDPELVTSFTASIEKFREDWDSIKLKLEESNKSFIEIELENKSDVQVVEEALLKLRKSYYIACEVNEDEEPERIDDEDESPKDLTTYNDPRNLCETGIYCPIAYFDYGVLWEGKPEFSVKYNSKIHYFSKEECSELFQKDPIRYQEYNKPFKTIPPIRLCIIGCIGSGKSCLSKLIAKELGLIHVDFSEFINSFLIPKHFKKVGRRYENSFTDSPMDEEGVMDFQMDEENENLASDILGSETELRRMVYNYFERGMPILPVLMTKLIKKLWFEEPFKKTGFVLDGYPRLPSDVEDMIASYCIPDLIIELEGNVDISLQRLSQKMYKTWKSQLTEARNIAKLKLDKEHLDWMNFITKNVVAKLIFEEILDNIFPSIDEPLKEGSQGSVKMAPDGDTVSLSDIRLIQFYSDMIQEYPAPIDQNEWEKTDEARERIDARIEGIYEVDDEGVQSLKDILNEQRIKIVSVNCAKPLNKVLRDILFRLANLRNRCCSLFEQTFVVNYGIAEMLLTEGFYFFSIFNRLCPVYILENPETILNPFKIIKDKSEVFPVIHRSYIYFIFSEENLIKFRNNPLKYISCKLINSFTEYPLSIAVIGPPKCGKSTLAHKLAKRYGLMCISRGKALRYIMENLFWTELASQMNVFLRKGNLIKYTCVVKAIQNIAVDHRVISNGFVFDGFPDSAAEAMELANTGLYPNMIIDITNNIHNSKTNSQNEIYYDIIKNMPPYSAPLIEYKYNEWKSSSYKVRNWIENDIQNLFSINGKESKWQCLHDAVSYIENHIPKIHYYLNTVSKNVVPAHCMGVSNEMFHQRMSVFKNLCPVCLHKKKIRHSGHPVHKEGVVQFDDKFYWVCDEHMDLVLKSPTRYLLTTNIKIPEVPAAVKTVNMSLVYENGICIVTYAHNLPGQKIVIGNNKFAASFRGQTYLFCSSECLDSFLAKPHMYFDIVVFKGPKIFPQLSLKNLPNIGYLEQTIGNIITDACCAVVVTRPKYPGLNIQVSALLYIALYLKTHNPSISDSILSLYEKASKIYDARCKLMIEIGLRLRSMDNPFAKYPKCCNRIRNVDSGIVKKPSSFANESTSISTNMSNSSMY